jgi:hypothetical protein
MNYGGVISEGVTPAHTGAVALNGWTAALQIAPPLKARL